MQFLVTTLSFFVLALRVFVSTTIVMLRVVAHRVVGMTTLLLTGRMVGWVVVPTLVYRVVVVLVTLLDILRKTCRGIRNSVLMDRVFGSISILMFGSGALVAQHLRTSGSRLRILQLILGVDSLSSSLVITLTSV